MRLKTTRSEYEFEDANGYAFTVVADYDPETGWHAAVMLGASGYKTPEAAIAKLASVAAEFQRQVEKT